MSLKKNDMYAVCKHIKRTELDYHVDEKLIKEMGASYKVLPTFEKNVFDHVYMNHYSLERNELFKCRWAQYKKHIEGRIFTPFQFPDIRDLHFYNARIQFNPSVTISRFPEYRMKLKPGPGVDAFGQMPIPQELLMKRGKIHKEDAVKKIVKVKKAV